MKKIILILAGALLFSASTFAMDLSVGVKGNLGGDASGIDGAVKKSTFVQSKNTLNLSSCTSNC